MTIHLFNTSVENIKVKKCSCCGEIKDICLFGKRKKSKDGLKDICVQCANRTYGKKKIEKEIEKILKLKKRLDTYKKKKEKLKEDMIKRVFSAFKLNDFKFCIKCGKYKEDDFINFPGVCTNRGNICNDCCSKEGYNHRKFKKQFSENSSFVFCKMCGVKYPNDVKYFHADNSTICKKCLFLKKKNRKAYPDKVREKISYHLMNIKENSGCVSSKICAWCGMILPMTEYYFQKELNKKTGLKGVCKKCRTGKFREPIEPHTKEEINHLNRIRRKSPTPYDSTLVAQISYAEETRNVDGYLQVKCKYCDRWFTPKYSNVEARAKSLNGVYPGESSFYCSSACKKSCPTFGMNWTEKTYKKSSSREANPTLRKMVLKRDGYACVKCGAKGKSVFLHCHHVLPATQNPMTANDPDNCQTLCLHCHKEVHKQNGCKYHELRCSS